MAKLCRCTWLPSSSSLLSCSLHLVAALLLFGGLVQCAKVGAGKHELDEKGKIAKLGSNMVMVKEGSDLSALGNLPEACHDVEWDGADWIKVLYKKDGAAKEGCVLDLVANKDTHLNVNIGIKYSNSECLATHNMLPFTYSLGEGQFEELKDGKNQARRGNSSNCWKETECLNRKGYCLKVADFMVGFGRDREYLMPMLTLVDEPVVWNTTLDGTILDGGEKKKLCKLDTSCTDFVFKLVIYNVSEDWETDVGDKGLNVWTKGPFCYKNDKQTLRDIKQWEITDKEYTDNEGFKYLFTLYLLPQKAARSRTEDLKSITDEMLDGPNCDFMYIKLSTKQFKLLVPPEKPTGPPMTRNGVDMKKTRKPKRRTTTEPEEEEEPSPASSSNVVVVVIITVVVFLIVLSIIGCLLWFLVFRKKEEKKEEEQQPVEVDYFGTTVGTTGAKGTSGGTSAKTKTGKSTVGSTQIKSGMSTTVGGGTTVGGTQILSYNDKSSMGFDTSKNET
uniref:Uncharacterized protein n=1 Tax=Meloidogyne enterolobii TaxID=390850 RepID=A0A6V7TJJ0_MELEN|nr:unnamed protein product [Meloidogyne enterolobii]